MPVTVRSFAKINLGLYIGRLRADGFHDLRTVYQTIALHDVIGVEIRPGAGIQILCTDARVPCDESNTCHRVAERVLEKLDAGGKVVIEIEKRLPVQGGVGAASSNAVATMLALERALKKRLTQADRLRIAADVGSDLPLFVIGGTSLGVGRGEEVYPVPDLPPIPMVVVLPEIRVSTPKAFADWDELTTSHTSDRLNEVGRALSAWLFSPLAGAPAKGGSRAGKLLLDLVRTGIENDFEEVVFPQHPELRDIKSELGRAGAAYASLSGSGSTLYGLFRTQEAAARAVSRLRRRGLRAEATTTLGRAQYAKRFSVSGF